MAFYADIGIDKHDSVHHHHHLSISNISKR